MTRDTRSLENMERAMNSETADSDGMRTPRRPALIAPLIAVLLVTACESGQLSEYEKQRREKERSEADADAKRAYDRRWGEITRRKDLGDGREILQIAIPSTALPEDEFMDQHCVIFTDERTQSSAMACPPDVF